MLADLETNIVQARQFVSSASSSMNIDVWPAHAQGSWDAAQSKNTRMRSTRQVAVAPSTAACAATVRDRRSRISRQTLEDTSSLLRMLHFVLVKNVMGRILAGQQKL
jgi:hypothetical protein